MISSAFCPIAAVGCLLASTWLASPAGAASRAPVGLPITRNYTLDEIGDVSRNARLTFDPIGRLAVISGDACVVLNDTSWIDIAERGPDRLNMLQFVTDESGNAYFGSLADWGMAEFTAGGKVRPRSFRPDTFPEWVGTTNFTHIIPQDEGVYFAGLNGVVFWERTTQEQTFFDIPSIASVFALDGQVFVSCHMRGIHRLDRAARTANPLPGSELETTMIEQVAPLGPGRVLVSTMDGRLRVFDGEQLSPWAGPLAGQQPGRASALQVLSDGGIAAAIDNLGLFILSPAGDVRLALTSPEYHRIHDLATQEAGVLWVVADGIVQKLFYGSAVTTIDQRLGLPVGWPQVAQWNERIVMASRGRLYEAEPTDAGRPTRFVPSPGASEHGVWAIATSGPHLLIGNNHGVMERRGERFEPVLTGIDVARLVMVPGELCYVIGSREITALRHVDGRWQETASRVPGVGFPAVTHAAGHSAWIELGANQVARITEREGRLHVQLMHDFPWSEPRWVNVGVIGNIVMLRGGDEGVLFFDEQQEKRVTAPEYQRLLAAAPFPITRMRQDTHGTLWATHEKGVLLVRPDPSQPSGYAFDAAFAGLVREFQPLLQLTGDDIWISTEKTLHHIDRAAAGIDPPPLQPRLVSVVDALSGTELYSIFRHDRPLAAIPYAKNNLQFRFFSGSYGSIRPPRYGFTITGPGRQQTIQHTHSLLALHDLTEGTYRVVAQVDDDRGTAAEPVVVEFAIAPPWFRSPVAYGLYGIAGILLALGVYSWAAAHARRRNAFLERLIRERTEELRSTMVKLSEETRNAAVLAERNRLAGEIHDSLQQGLSGLMLQLDATLKLPSLEPDVRSRLTVARNMVSFTRHEVQQAVWDLESPLLENTDLADALRKMAAVISSGRPHVEVKATGVTAKLDSGTQHQLLRIAQEAITNAVRHGKARKIFVHLEYSAGSVSLEIFDDGCGFVPKEVFVSGLGHFGLRGLRARAAKINADLQIISAPNRGTTVRIVIPLNQPAPAPVHAAVTSA